MDGLDLEYGGAVESTERTALEKFFSRPNYKMVESAVQKLLSYRVIDVANWVHSDGEYRVLRRSPEEEIAAWTAHKYPVSSHSQLLNTMPGHRLMFFLETR
jgi:hypothetical protein